MVETLYFRGAGRLNMIVIIKIMSLLISVVSILSGCASMTGAKLTSIVALEPDKAVVYIYRLDDNYRQVLNSYQPKVFVDGEMGIVVPRRGYGVLYLDPGFHHLTIQYSWGICSLEGLPNAQVKKEFQSGVIEFYKITSGRGEVALKRSRLGIEVSVCTKVETSIEFVQEDIALFELKETSVVN